MRQPGRAPVLDGAGVEQWRDHLADIRADRLPARSTTQS
jgi:hypothetical protein